MKLNKKIQKKLKIPLNRKKKKKKKKNSTEFTRNCFWNYQLELKKRRSFHFLQKHYRKVLFNKNKRFVVTPHFENHRGSEFYRVQELDTIKKVEGRFLRKELFAVKNNVERSQINCTKRRRRQSAR